MATKAKGESLVRKHAMLIFQLFIVILLLHIKVVKAQSYIGSKLTDTSGSACKSIEYMCTADGIVYLYGENEDGYSLFRLDDMTLTALMIKPDEEITKRLHGEQLAKWAIDVSNSLCGLASSGDDLYGIFKEYNTNAKAFQYTLYRLEPCDNTIVSRQFVMVLDLLPGERYIQKFFADHNKLYVWANSTYAPHELLSFNLSDGAMKRQELSPNLNDLVYYRDGMFVAGYFDLGRQVAYLRLFDMAANKMSDELPVNEEIGIGNISTLACDAVGNTFYFLLNDMAVACEGNELKAFRQLGTIQIGSLRGGFVTAAGKYVVYDSRSIWSVDKLNKANEAVTELKLINVWTEKASMAFQKQNPGIVLINEYLQADAYDKIIQDMLSRSDTVDIYGMHLSSGVYSSLYQRGYLTDLTQNDGVRNMVEQVYPQIRDCMIHDGKVVALPVSLTAMGLGYNMKAMNKVGMDQKDLPDTWSELFDFVDQWIENGYLEEYPEIALFDTDDVKPALLHQLLYDYAAWVQVNKLAWDDGYDMLQILLRRIEHIDNERLAQNSFESIINETYLFSVYADLQIGIGKISSPLRLRLTPEAKPVMCGDLYVLIVNPYSSRKEKALRYLECVTENLDAWERINMMPDHNEPLHTAGYDDILDKIQRSIAVAQAQLNSADDTDIKSLQELIRSLTDELEYTKENSWDISPETIVQYRSYSQNIVIMKERMFQNTELTKLMRRYLYGQIDSQIFLAELNEIVRMKQKETN